MDRPSIKGTAFESAAADLAALTESGRLQREELEARLRPVDLAVLGEKILASDWYPMDTYGRVLELLGDVEGRGRADYHVGRGARAAERLMGMGIYRQAETAERLKERAGEDWREPVANLMLTMGKALFNFMGWHYRQNPADESQFSIEVSEAAAFPDCARLTVQGFIEFAARKVTGDPRLEVTSVRPSDDLIVYHCRGGL